MPTLGVCRVPGTEALLREATRVVDRITTDAILELGIAPVDTSGLIRYGGEFWPEPVVRASGSFVETASGRRVLDFTAGQICATIGHNHPRVAAEIRRALDDVVHLNSWMLSPPVLELANALLATLPPSLSRRSSSRPAASRSRSPSGWRSSTRAASRSRR